MDIIAFFLALLALITGGTNDDPTPAPEPAPVVTTAPAEPEPFDHTTLPECPTEDSDNCWWDASARGNGEGRSFYVIDGEVTYLD